MNFPRLIATIAAALAFAAPVSASIVTYDVTISGGSYSSRMNSFDYGLGVNTDLGEIDPAINGMLGMTAHFAIDTTQGSPSNPMFPEFFQSSNGAFVNSTISTDQPTPGLVSTATGTQYAQAYRFGSSYTASVFVASIQEYYDGDGAIIRRVSQFVGHVLSLSNVTDFTMLDGRAFPKLNGAGITASLVSNYDMRDYDFRTGVELYRYWEATASGELGVTASVTDSLGTNAVPEPASLALLGVGLVGLAARRRRRVTA